MNKKLEAEPFVPVDFQLSNGSIVQVCLDDDNDEVIVRLHGLRCGEMLVIPRAGNAIRIKSSGRGVAGKTSNLNDPKD